MNILINVLTLVVSILLWGAVHSILASVWFKAWLRRKAGEKIMRFYRLAYNLVSLLTFLPVLWLAATLPDQTLYIIPWPWVALTTAGQLFAAILLGVGVFQTGVLDFTGLSALLSSRPPEPERLVTNGLYRWVRHPLYTAGLLFIWLTPVMTINLLTMYAAATVYIILGAYYEERKLLQVFGAEYARYQASTPMLLPRWKRPGQ